MIVVPVIDISIDELPRHLRGFADQVPFAASRALNDTAFEVKKQMPALMGDDLTLRNKFTAGGSVRFDRADKRNLTATVGSVAWYLPRNIEGGEQKPKQGITFNGKKYLLIPNKDRRNKRGYLKDLPASVTSGAFPIRSGDNLVLVVRRTFRGKERLLPLGLLVEEAKWESAFDWDAEVNRVIGNTFPDAFARRMEQAARSAR